VPEGVVPPAPPQPTMNVAPRRAPVAVPAAHRAWAAAEGFAVPEATERAEGDAVRLSIAAPEHNSRLWRNPELPPRLNRLMLRAVVEPRVPQVVWYVDGEPFAVTDPDQPVAWPMTPGAHRFQLRLPFRDGVASSPVRIVVE
jgi:penicillin-binding protein 1C